MRRLFYKNSELNLPVNDGWLTDIRTAAAGAVAAKYLANDNIDTIGIVGTGVQARLQLMLLRDVVQCQTCLVWGRDAHKAQAMIDELYQDAKIKEWGIAIKLADDLEQLALQSRLIVTTTSARRPLLQAEMVQKGTHITAMGSDDHGKQELDVDLLARADRVVADSISQCIDHGECYSAINNQRLDSRAVVELGAVINNPQLGRTHEKQITIADLTGVAVQDIKVANMVAKAYFYRHNTKN